MSKKYIYILTILTILFTLSSSLALESFKKVNSLTVNIDKFNNVNSDGSFVLYSDDNKTLKIKKDFTKENNKIRQFNWYSDFACGDCINLHKNTNEIIKKQILQSDLEIKYYPLNFLSKKYKNNYSLYSASYLTGLAEYGSGEDVFNLFEDLMNNESRDELVKSKDIEKDIEKFILSKNNISKNVLKKVNQNIIKLKYAINQGSINIRRDEDLIKRSPKEEKTFFTPYIYNNKDNNENAILTESEEAVNNVLEAVTETNNFNLDTKIKPCDKTCL